MDVAEREPDVARRLLAELAARESGGGAVAPTRDLTPGETERLRSLGYLE
jgi:hypothetical protein